mmetsp:Transcript_29642/g.71209  ORF Transcript_29642/g.71209 Transcript_29642/m.71209 type:complete len:581 (+) Transcript_29642:56-1798(+)
MTPCTGDHGAEDLASEILGEVEDAEDHKETSSECCLESPRRSSFSKVSLGLGSGVSAFRPSIRETCSTLQRGSTEAIEVERCGTVGSVALDDSSAYRRLSYRSISARALSAAAVALHSSSLPMTGSMASAPARVQPHELAAALQEAVRMLAPCVSKNKFVKSRSNVSGFDCIFAGYHVVAMRAVRKHFGILEDEFLQSVCDTPLRGGGRQRSGKSGAWFWFSSDNRYVVKYITRSERQSLSSLLARYLRHIRSRNRTYLPVLCGAFKVACRGMEARLLIMNNVFHGAEHCDDRFDLKGTTEDRFVRGISACDTGKDLNFGDRKIHIPGPIREELAEAICSDVDWLSHMGIMDYSLLLGISKIKTPIRSSVHDATKLSPFDGWEGGLLSLSSEEGCCVLYMGFIDILQMYTVKKKAAHCVKKWTVGCVREIDTEPPSYYAARIKQYLLKKLRAVDMEEMVDVAQTFQLQSHIATCGLAWPVSADGWRSTVDPQRGKAAAGGTTRRKPGPGDPEGRKNGNAGRRKLAGWDSDIEACMPEVCVEAPLGAIGTEEERGSQWPVLFGAPVCQPASDDACELDCDW